MNHKTRNRTGAAAVEFAMVAPLFFLGLFVCFEFGRMSMVEAFAEDAAFRAARHVVVLGATIDESSKEAADRLAILGVRNEEITIEPSVNGSIQDEIDDDTDSIAVRISILVGENVLLSGFFRDLVIEQEAVIATERF